ncbi:MAG: hypothetical protein RBU30_04685, partial [Polyangia bacterium]|nr:hypothetical protein [Polyangia bacterium]
RVVLAESLPGPRYLALGVLLAPTRHKELAFIFLEAGLSYGKGRMWLERVRRWLLWQMGLHDQATQGAWRMAEPTSP